MTIPAAVDFETVLKRLGDDTELLLDIIGIFLEVTPSTVERLGRAVLAADFAAVVELAHELKGSSANLGAAELRRQASLLEMSARQRLTGQVAEHHELLRQELARVVADLERYRSDLMPRR